MSNINVTRQGPEVMADNPSRTLQADYTNAAREFIPAKPASTDWRTLVAKGALIGGGWLLAATTYGLWKNAPFVGYCTDFQNYATCAALTQAEPAVFLGLPVVAAAVTVWQHIKNTQADLRQKRAVATRTGLVLDRFGNQAPADLFDRMHPAAMLDYLERRYAMDVALKRETAPYEKYWGVNSLSEGSVTSTTSTQAAGLLTDGGVTPAPVPLSEWLPWLTNDAYPHLLLVGRTRSGKSTLADIALSLRAARGDKIVVLDPHWSTQDAHGNRKWGGIEPAATDIDGIIKVLKALKAEYEDRKRRMKLPADNPEFVPELCFEPVSVLLDEANEVYDELERRGLKDLWAETIRTFGSGGAKVNLELMLLAQSPNVAELGLSGPMRSNFTTFALSNTARPFIINNASKDESKDLLALLDGASKPGLKPSQLPAAAEYGGRVMVLSRDGILNHRQAHISAELWRPTTADGRLDGCDDLLESLLAEEPSIHPSIQREAVYREEVLAGGTKAEQMVRIKARLGACDSSFLSKVRQEAQFSV